MSRASAITYYMCFGCEPESEDEEEIATIQLDADEAGEAETQYIVMYFLTLTLLTVELFYVLAPGRYQRPQHLRHMQVEGAVDKTQCFLHIMS